MSRGARTTRVGNSPRGGRRTGSLASGERLFFEDLASLEEEVVVAERGGLGGVTYWSIGGEPGRAAFFSMIERHFPR